MNLMGLKSGVVGVACAAQTMRRGRQLIMGVVLAGLMFATSQAQAVLVTVRLVDQNDADIPGSVIGGVATGSTVVLPEGTHSFNLQVGKNGASGNGNLERTGTAEVTASTTEIAFEWITSDIVLRLHDQAGVDIPGSKIGELVPVTVTLPITDESIYPTMRGVITDGFNFNLQVGKNGATGNGNLERTGTAEVIESTTEIAFEWITSDIVLRLHDQAGVDIPASIIGGFPPGTTFTLPITDEGIYPTMRGGNTDGFNFGLQVGKNGAGGNGNLERFEIEEVTASTTEIAFEWIQLSCTITVLDTSGDSVPGSSVHGPGPATPIGGTITLPITDESIYPTMTGLFSDGFLIAVTPGDIAPTFDTIAFEVLGAAPEFSPDSFVIGGNTYSLGCIPPDSDGDGVNDDDDACPDSDLSTTIVIDGNDTGVENCQLGDGCSLADLVAELIANDPSTAAVVQMLIELKAAGLLTGQEMGAILHALNGP